jgi:hypothetical protein
MYKIKNVLALRLKKFRICSFNEYKYIYLQCDEINQAACDIAKKVSAKYNTIVAGNTRRDSAQPF